MTHLMNNYGERSITLVRGDGAYVFDDTGKEYLDFAAGIAVVSLGHAHPDVTKAVADQAGQLIHCSNLYMIPGQIRVAEKLCELSGLQKVLFCNSGTEANEGAFKLARKFAAKNNKDRNKVISLPGAFHGRTMGALSITPKKAYQDGFGPMVPNCVTPDSFEDVLAQIDEATAACFVEVIQGEGGVHVLSQDFLQELEKKLHDYGALLVIDEVQTGIGRTGTFFAFEQMNLHPDIVTVAKGLGNGVPVGAVLATADVASAFEPGNHGTTFGGNPLAMAVAEVVVSQVATPNFLKHVREMGDKLAAVLSEYGENVSGLGLMRGVDIKEAKSFVKAAAASGVLLTATSNERVRVVPPLIINDMHLNDFAKRLNQIPMK